MCAWGTHAAIDVLIPADLSATGHPRRRAVNVDACIAPIVAALDRAGIAMRGSCCGHGKADGEIELADGRRLVVSR